MIESNKTAICENCKGKGKITVIHDTQMETGGQLITLSSEKGETRPCDKCGGSGFLQQNQ